MKSKTKNMLTDDTIRTLVRANLGDNSHIGKITELEGGMFNSAYLIEVDDNNLVLKVAAGVETPLLSYEKNIMAREVEVYRLIEGKEDFPAPDILAVDFSRNHINSDYFFMTELKGEAMNTLSKKLKKDNLEKIKEEMARYFAVLHRIKGEYFGYFTDEDKYRFANWRDGFLHMFTMILEDGRERKIKLPYQRIEKVLKATAPYLDEVKEPSLVNYDLWAGNVFLIQKDGEYVVEGILDFERAFWGDPLADFPAAMMLLKEIEKEKNFFEAYSRMIRRDKNLSENEKTRLILYRLYIHIIMAVETYRYGSFYGFMQRSYAKSIISKCIKKLEEKR